MPEGIRTGRCLRRVGWNYLRVLAFSQRSLLLRLGLDPSHYSPGHNGTDERRHSVNKRVEALAWCGRVLYFVLVSPCFSGIQWQDRL